MAGKLVPRATGRRVGTTSASGGWQGGKVAPLVQVVASSSNSDIPCETQNSILALSGDLEFTMLCNSMVTPHADAVTLTVTAKQTKIYGKVFL